MTRTTAFQCGEVAPSDPRLDDLWREAGRHHAAGDLTAAEACLKAVVARRPEDAAAVHLLGVICLQRDDVPRAVDLMRRAVELAPGEAQFHGNLGVALRRRGDLDGAAAAYRQALRLAPDFADAWSNLGNVQRAQGDPAGAVACYRRAISLTPDEVQLYNALGSTYRDLGRGEAERHCYREAIRRCPDYAEAHNNLGNSLLYAGRLEEAEACYRQALTIDATLTSAANNLASALVIGGRLSEAVDCLRRVLRERPDYPEAINNLGSALQGQGRIREALVCYRRAVSLKPDYRDAQSNLLLAMHYADDIRPAELAAAAFAWGDRQAARHLPAPGPRPVAAAGRRLRIGYVSADLREHSVSYFLRPLLAAHDRERFAVFGYASVKRPDAVTGAIRQQCDQWRDIRALTDEQAAGVVRGDGIDLLVDLGGHTAGNRLGIFARRPAPVQLTWLGYPDTTGLAAMDYRISDAVADPPGWTDRWNRERIIRLPEGFLCYAPPADAPPVAPLPALDTGQVTFGSFNNLAKINPAVIDIWSAVLCRVPGARLLLKAKSLADTRTREHLLAGFARHGVDAGRIVLVSARATTAEHLAGYRQVDIGLDSFPYNGTTTTCEALWMGVPVVTWRGDRHSARVGASILGQVGLADLVAEDGSDYVARCTNLAGNLGRLIELRDGLRAILAASPLCDAAGFARRFEAALITAWQAAVTGAEKGVVHGSNCG